jgi:hypothetical protein
VHRYDLICGSRLRNDLLTPVIARRGDEHGSGLGTMCWVVEQGFALPPWSRRLRIRWEIRDDIHEAFPRIRLRPDLPAPPPQLRG